VSGITTDRQGRPRSATKPSAGANESASVTPPEPQPEPPPDGGQTTIIITVTVKSTGLPAITFDTVKR
jgi:hypothetical protein